MAPALPQKHVVFPVYTAIFNHRQREPWLAQKQACTIGKALGCNRHRAVWPNRLRPP